MPIFEIQKTFHASYEHACLKGKYQLSSSTNTAIVLWYSMRKYQLEHRYRYMLVSKKFNIIYIFLDFFFNLEIKLDNYDDN